METADKLPAQIVIAEDNPADVKLVRMALRDAGMSRSMSSGFLDYLNGCTP